MDIPAPVVVEQIPTGTIKEGRYADNTLAFQIDVPPGWSASTGTNNGAMRVRLTHADTGALVEAWVYDERLTSPRERPFCAWSFQDVGPYNVVPQLERLTVATCTPSDLASDRIFGHLVPEGSRTWQLELHVPIEQLSAGMEAGSSVLRTVRFR